MSPMEAFLQRLAQHVQSQTGPNLGNIPLVSGLGEAVLRPAYNAAGDIGLGLEATQKLGNYAAGEGVLGMQGIQDFLNTTMPAVFTSPADQNVLAQGPMHPQAALDAARNGPDSMTAWLAGALAMAADPANLIPLPIGNAARGENLAAQAARKAAKFTPTQDLLQTLEAAVPQATQAVADNAAPLTLDLGAVSGKANAVANATKAQTAWEKAQAEYDAAKGLYNDVQSQKAAAMKDVLDPLRVNGRLPRGFKNSPEYARLSDETKRAVEVMNPEGPQDRQAFGAFMAGKGQNVKAARIAAQDAQDELANAFSNAPQNNFLNQALENGKQAAAPIADSNWEQLPDGTVRLKEAAPATPVDPMHDLAGQNEMHNALDLAQTPVRSADESGWFAAPDPAQGDVAANPLKAQATQVATPVKAQDGSVPTQEPGYVSHMWDLIKYGLSQGVQATKESYSQPFKRLGLKDVAGVWAGVNIETPRNAIQDIVYNRWLLNNEGVRQRYITTAEKAIGDRVRAGETNPIEMLGPMADYLKATGTDIAPTKVTKGVAALDTQAQENIAKQIVDDLGGNGYKLEADNAQHLATMNGLQKALIGTGLQFADPMRAITGVATLPMNFVMDLRHEVFHIVNNTTHMASRIAAFEDAFLPYIQNSAKDMLQRAAAEGKDVSGLTGRGFKRYADVMATDGAFSPADVAANLGDRYAAEWKATVDQALAAGYDNSKRVLGNFADKTPGEAMVSKFVPFMSWSWRAYPRAASYVLQHPAVGVALMHLYAADRQNAQQEGRPGYQVGMLSVNKDTPLLGLLASAFTPEQEATVRLNPLALFSPVSGDLLATGLDNGQQDQSTTAYQKAKAALGIVGASFNPLIQTGAYVTGQDYTAPGAASRYAPIDAALGQATNLEAPTIQGPLRAVRKLVTGKADNYDPIEAKAKELVFEKTGKPLSDPSNKAYAQQIASKAGVYEEARTDANVGGARRAAVNAVSPVSLTATTDTTAARQAAAKGVPFSYDDIQGAKAQGLDTTVKAMQAANNQYYAANPAAAVSQNAPAPSKADTQATGGSSDPRVLAWASKPENAMLRELAPSTYAMRLAEYKKAIGAK